MKILKELLFWGIVIIIVVTLTIYKIVQTDKKHKMNILTEEKNKYKITQLKFRNIISDLKSYNSLDENIILGVLSKTKHSDAYTYKPLHFLSKSNTIYSVGPDRKDQEGSVFYDPTNGLYSYGDIVLIIEK